jgi:sugar lactone lactonase YvrE
VLRVSPGGQSTLTTNAAPPGLTSLDDPADMAFLPGGDIVVTDQGFTSGVPQVVEVDPGTGTRTLLSGAGRGTGPALVMPNSVAVEATGNILVTDIAPVTGNPRLLRIDPATGNRRVLTGVGVGGGPAVNVAAVGIEGGVIYVTDVVGNQIMSVAPVTGNRTLISGPGLGAGAPFVSPVSITSDRPGSIVVLDMERPAGAGLGLGGLVRVDLATGDRTLISSNARPTSVEQFDTPIDVQYNACENAFYVLQTGFSPAAPDGRVLKVDAVTGVRSLFASYTGAENYALLLRPILVTPPVP